MTGINALILIATVAPTDPVPQADPGTRTLSEEWGKPPASGHHLTNAIVGGSLATLAVMVPTVAVFAFVGFQDFCLETTKNPCPSQTSEPLLSNAQTYALIVFGLGSVTFVPFGAWLGHSLSKGKGDFKSAVIGSAIGTALTAALVLGANAISRDTDGPASNTASTTLMVLAALAPSTGAVIGLERSHASQAVPRVGFIPTSGGGKLSLSWNL